MNSPREVAKAILEFAEAWADFREEEHEVSVAVLIELVASGQVKMWEEGGEVFFEGVR